MLKKKTKLFDRILAVTVTAVIMLIAMIPSSALAVSAETFSADDECQEKECSGKLQWVEEEDGEHYLVCNNSECSRSDIKNAYSSHENGKGGEDCLICNPAPTHEHNFTYKAKGSTLTATCSSEGCNLTDSKVSITINAPTDLCYNGKVKTAIIEGEEEWKTAGLEIPEITYKNSNGSDVDAKDVDTYTASITAGTSTASVEFEISYLPTPKKPYTVYVGKVEKQPNEDGSYGWFNKDKDVVIKPAEGFTIGTSYNREFKTEEEISVSHATEIILKNADGYYTDKIDLGAIKIDQDDPNVKIDLYENKELENSWTELLETITFGIFRKQEQTFVITADDGEDNEENNKKGISGVESIQYYLSETEEIYTTEEAVKKNITNWTKYDKEITCDVNKKYVLYAKVTDKAGNVTYASSDGLVIENTKPEIEISFDNNNAKNEKYFNLPRTATITITEENFDAGEVIVEIVANVAVKDKDGSDIKDINEYVKELENWVSDGDKHTLIIKFTEDAEYTFNIKCKDLAGNENYPVTYKERTVAGKEFIIDQTNPNAEVSVETENLLKAWKTEKGENRIISNVDYNIWLVNDVTVSASSEDNLSGIDYIEYYKSATYVEDITKNSNIEWESYNKSIVVSPNEKFIIYIHAVDKAGKEVYLSSNGVIVDNKAPEIDIDIPNKANSNGIYNDGDTVKVDFNIADPKYAGKTKSDGGVCSGISKITYKIEAKDIKALEEGEVKLDKGIVIDEATKLISSWNGSIVIDKEKFNSNKVVVSITAIDNAGNEFTASTKVGDIKIDVTKPKIDISYDNNNAENAKYFKANRTATIVVTERNFKAEDVKIKITNTDGKIPTIGKWTETKGTGNLDDTRWTATITYNADGDYTFDIGYTDLADNACAGAQYGNSVAPKTFTIDKTLPVVSVSYNNNNAKNEKYFNAPRTATIVVNEHNFNVNDVTFTQTASLNGENITIPAASWSNNGDIHTATIVFDKDGDYTFDVAVKDLAANNSNGVNYGDSVAAKDFVVDQTIVKPSIGGVKNGSAYKKDVIPTISFNDVNYDSYEVKLVRTRMGKKNVDVTSEFIKNISEQAQGGSASFDTFEEIVENDGIYTLTVKMTDKAGNEESEEYRFTVNRFGSVYEYSDELVDLIKDGGQYIQSVGKDLTITEYNAERILNGSLKILITRDGEPVDVDYTSNPKNFSSTVGIGTSGWYEYIYTIKAANFEQDGKYKISLSSKYATSDSAENDSTSVPENSIDSKGKDIVDSMEFTVDSVAPEIQNVVNLDKKIADKDKIVDGKLNVQYTVFDVGGLKSIEIIVNGNTVQSLTEKDLKDNAYNYTGSFDISEQDSTSAQSVRIKVTDLAGNVTDTDSEEFLDAHNESNEDSTYIFNNKVTVSRNFFVRWYANKALFWGIIGGVIVVAAIVCFAVSAKKRKQSADK